MPLLFYAIAFILLFISIRKNKTYTFFEKNNTNSLKGFFILLIVFGHILNNYNYTVGMPARIIAIFRTLLGQEAVSIFFLISGFGIVEKCKKDSIYYPKTLFINRFLRIIVYTTFFLVPFWTLSIIKNDSHLWSDYFTSALGLTSFGNTSWYILAILVCYLSASISFFNIFKSIKTNVFICSFLIILYILLKYFLDRTNYYTYDTIFCFIIGMFISCYNDKISQFLRLRKYNPLITMITSLLLCIGCSLLLFDGFNLVTEYNELFIMIIYDIGISMFFISATWLITFKSQILNFLSKSSYAIFMIHMFPIRLFQTYVFIDNMNILYLLLFPLCIASGIPFYYGSLLIDKFTINPILTKIKLSIEKQKGGQHNEQ